jgi:hypothetical protein
MGEFLTVSAASTKALDQRGDGAILGDEQIGVDIQAHLANLSRNGNRRWLSGANSIDRFAMPVDPVVQLEATVVTDDSDA